ncbi:uncharacterized protein BKA55DRAFT_716850, partial [Fusarium redolens]
FHYRTENVRLHHHHSPGFGSGFFCPSSFFSFSFYFNLTASPTTQWSLTSIAKPMFQRTRCKIYRQVKHTTFASPTKMAAGSENLRATLTNPNSRNCLVHILPADNTQSLIKMNPATTCCITQATKALETVAMVAKEVSVMAAMSPEALDMAASGTIPQNIRVCLLSHPLLSTPGPSMMSKPGTVKSCLFRTLPTVAPTRPLMSLMSARAG